ncbi:MAG: hypothetical protein HRU70_01230 [Phycisphaeraceae bacterium]|nr:MAG: hypothetical protein HRU70_01230 [Phycisphaeraceae bacterium]
MFAACGLAAGVWAPPSGPGRAEGQPPELPAFPDFDGPKVQAAATPDAGAAIGAFNLARGWIDGWSVPEGAPDPPGFEGVWGVWGVSVVLRHQGEVVGRGVVIGGGSVGGPGMLGRAVGSALAGARAARPVQDDALAEERRRVLAGELTLTLELAGGLVPLRERTYDEVDASLAPGLDGVAVRRGERVEAVFPGSMLSGQASAGDSAAMLVGRVFENAARGLRVDPEAQPGVLREREGVVFSRFRTAHLTQAEPGGPPIFLYRGHRVIRTWEVTGAELERTAAGIAAHLARRVDESGAVRGTYQATLDRHEPELAPVAERALVAYALGRHEARVRDEDLARVSRSIASGLAALARGDEEEASSPAALFSLWLAVAGAGVAEDSLRGLGEEAGALDVRSVPLTALRLAAKAVSARGADARSRAASEIEAFASTLNMDQLAASCPWLVIAEDAVRGEGPRGPTASARWRSFRDDAYRAMISAADATEDQQDLIGGLVLSGGGPLPTAQSARVIAALSLLMGDPAVTPASEKASETVRLLPGLRFLRQLSADGGSAWMHRNPERSAFGVRAAAWDQRMPGEASALSLLALTGVLSALDAGR